MTGIPLTFRTNESKYKFSGDAKLINAYAEEQKTDAKTVLAVLGCYGLTLERAVTDTPCRGTIYLDDKDCIYTAHSTSVYRVNPTGSAIRVGTLPGNDVVEFSRNQADPVQVSIHCDAGEFYIENDVLKSVTDTDLPDGTVSQDHLGGYTVYGNADRRFFISSINACQEVNATDYATAEQSPDPLVRVKADGDLFLFKKKQTEQWRNTGNADFPFEPIGVPIRHGLLAKAAVASFDNSLVFVADDAIVYRVVGTGTVQRISTHGIERLIEGDPNQAQIKVFPHTIEGHSFVTVTGTDWSRTFDAATGLWHSRESYQLGSWRARFPVRAWGKTIVGDSQTGNLYSLDKNAYSEGSEPLIWGIDTQTYHSFPNGGVMDALHIDVNTGVGLTSGQGVSPKLMVSWSTDGGARFKGNRELSLGAYGNAVRVTTRRLGRYGPKGVMFRIRISDPVIRAIVGFDLQTRPLRK